MFTTKSYTTRSGKGVLELLTKYGARAKAALGKQLYLEGEGIITQAKQLAPVDTGTLRSSGYVAPPVSTPDKVSVELGFGGPTAKRNPKSGALVDSYAIYVHEDLEAHHTVGMAKFLEIPFNHAKAGMTKRIAAGMKTDLRNGGSLFDIPPEGSGNP